MECPAPTRQKAVVERTIQPSCLTFTRHKPHSTRLQISPEPPSPKSLFPQVRRGFGAPHRAPKNAHFDLRRFGVRIPTGARRARRQRQRPPERFSPGVFRVECRASAPSRERSERPRRTDREAAGQDADMRFCRFSGLLSRCLHSVIPAAQLPWGLCGDRPPSNRGRTLRLSSRYTFGENCRYACSCTHRANRPALDVLGARFTGQGGHDRLALTFTFERLIRLEWIQPFRGTSLGTMWAPILGGMTLLGGTRLRRRNHGRRRQRRDDKVPL